MPIKVLSLYDGLFVGGSRIVHTDIITGLQKDFQQNHAVLSLTNRVTRENTTQYANETDSWKFLEDSGIKVQALDRDNDTPWTAENLIRLEDTIEQADIILSLKEQPLLDLDLIRWNKPLIVSIHRSDPDSQGDGLYSLLRNIQGNKIHKVISCGHSARKSYIQAGIPSKLIETVENGIDLNKFQENSEKRQTVRDSIGASETVPVIMIAARFDEVKDIPLFMESAGCFLKHNPFAAFIVCGTGMTRDNQKFQELLDKYIPVSLQSRIFDKGIVNTADYYPAADIVSLTSIVEASPLCILEGMATGCIPVVTDAGDSASMVKGLGIVTSRVASEIAESWAVAYAERDKRLPKILERRNSFSDKKMIARYAGIIGGVDGRLY